MKTDTAKKWWEMPVRMLRVDYLPDFSRVKEEDLDKLARSRKEDWQINCEWIIGVPYDPGGGGDHTTFKATGYETYPGFDNFDYLRTYTPFAHKYGIKVLSYLNMHWYSYEFAEKHPDWEQITSTTKSYGKVKPLYGNGTTFCVNSSWRNWAFGLIGEAMKTGIDGIFLDGPIFYPDCCYCPACQEKFKSTYGQPIPKEDWNDPLWKKFLEFRDDSVASFLAGAQKEVQKINPDGVIFMNAGGWEPGGWRVARDIQNTCPFQNFNGAEAFFHYGNNQNIYASLMTGKYLRAGGKPAVVFTHYMNGLWHYRNLPPRQVQLALMQTVSCGANPWLALVRSSLKSQPDSHQPVREIFEFLEQQKELYVDTESIAEAGLLFSYQTSGNYLSRFEEFYETFYSDREENLSVDLRGVKTVDWALRKEQCDLLLHSSYKGYFHTLTRAHILFDILLDQDLMPEKLSKYKILILPDGACLSREVAENIQAFVRNGGKLLCSFEAGLYDEEGNFTEDFFELLGIESVQGIFPVIVGENYLQVTQGHLGFRNGILVERGPYVLKVKPRKDTSTPAFFLEPVLKSYVSVGGISSHPAMVLNTYGKGRVVYFPEAIGHFLGTTGMPTAEARVTGMVRELCGCPVMEMEAPKSVSVELFRQKSCNRIVVHLVNQTVDGTPVDDFIPVRDIVLRLHLGQQPKKVYPVRENVKVVHEFNDGQLEIKVPQISLYEVIVIDV